MLTSIEFYIAVPRFLYLKDVALESRRQLQEKKDCVKCFHEWNAMRGVCDAFFLKIKELVAANDPALNDIKLWLSTRKGYSISKCVLFYRRSRTQGAIAKLEF